MNDVERTILAAHLEQSGYKVELYGQRIDVLVEKGVLLWKKHRLVARISDKEKTIRIDAYGMPVFAEALQDFIAELCESSVEVKWAGDEPMHIYDWCPY